MQSRGLALCPAMEKCLAKKGKNLRKWALHSIKLYGTPLSQWLPPPLFLFPQILVILRSRMTSPSSNPSLQPIPSSHLFSNNSCTISTHTSNMNHKKTCLVSKPSYQTKNPRRSLRILSARSRFCQRRVIPKRRLAVPELKGWRDCWLRPSIS